MIVALIFAALAINSRAWLESGLLVAAVVDQRVAVVAVGATVLWERRSRPDPAFVESVFLATFAAQLRSGASIRPALEAAVGDTETPALRRTARIAAAGRPIDEVASELSLALPVSGASAAIALQAGTASGGQLAVGFDALVEVVFDEAELVSEVDAASASARASAWLIGSIPVLIGAGLAMSGRLGDLAALGAVGWVMGLVGLGLVLAGAAVIVSMVGRAGR